MIVSNKIAKLKNRNIILHVFIFLFINILISNYPSTTRHSHAYKYFVFNINYSSSHGKSSYQQVIAIFYFIESYNSV